jgi:hypothetical protein
MASLCSIRGASGWDDADMPPHRRKQGQPRRPGEIAFATTIPEHDWGDLGDRRSLQRFEAIATELAERYREILPRGRFKVEVKGTGVVIRALPPGRGAGSTCNGPGWVPLLAPAPRKFQLRLFLEEEARGVQEFVRHFVTDWPHPNAEPHVAVTDQLLRVWYGTNDEAVASVRLRPLDRALFDD